MRNRSHHRARVPFPGGGLTAFLLCLGLLLVACGDQPPSPTPVAAPTAGQQPTAATGGAPTTVAVDLKDFKFAPADITIVAGSTVVWTNRDPAKHTVSADDGSFESGTMELGATFSRKFDTAGTFGYFCKFHGSAGQGMFGTVHVTASANTASGPTAVPVSVDLKDFKFAPADITVPAGTKVIWTNKDPAKHTVSADDGSFESGTMEQGAVFSRTFDTAGTFGYFCKFHGSAGNGMFGTVHVTAAVASGGAPTATTGAPPAAPPTNTAAPVAVATATTAPPQPTATAPPPAHGAGDVSIKDDHEQSDQVTISFSDLPARPAGKAYYAWLVNSTSGASANLGRFDPNADGTASVTYDDPAQSNLLKTYDKAILTHEDLEVVPVSPSADVVLSGQLPPGGLVHIRHLLVSFPDTPEKIGLIVGLRSQVNVLLVHTGYLNDSQKSGNLANVYLHAEHLVNIIEGAKGADYGDLNKDGKVTNPGDGYGLLANGNQLGYLQGTKDHAELAANAPDATDPIKIHAAQVSITTDNISGWVKTIRDRALAILKAGDLQATAPLVQEITTLADHAYNGVVLEGNTQVLPVAGSGGAVTGYQYAQLMATFRIVPGGSQGETPAPPLPPAPSGFDTPTPGTAPAPSGFDTPVPSGFNTPVPSGFDTPVPSGFNTPVPSGFDTPTP